MLTAQDGEKTASMYKKLAILAVKQDDSELELLYPDQITTEQATLWRLAQLVSKNSTDLILDSAGERRTARQRVVTECLSSSETGDTTLTGDMAVIASHLLDSVRMQSGIATADAMALNGRISARIDTLKQLGRPDLAKALFAADNALGLMINEMTSREQGAGGTPATEK